MIAVDTSVAIAAFASWHEAHQDARGAVTKSNTVLVAHCALETYSVLTRLPPPHRAPGRLVHEYLEVQFPEPYLVLPVRAQRGLTERLVELDIAGGAVYDALVGLTAASAGAELVSLDRRAAATYERCGVAVAVIG